MVKINNKVNNNTSPATKAVSRVKFKKSEQTYINLFELERWSAKEVS